jgi:hypothetical protein
MPHKSATTCCGLLLSQARFFLTANIFYHHYCNAAAEAIPLGMPKRDKLS